MSKIYKKAGVDIKRNDECISNLSKIIGKNNNQNLDNFCAIENINFIKQYKNPEIIMSTDGIGSKILLHLKFKTYNYLAQDLLAMNINDIITKRGKPLYFQDYISLHKNHNDGVVENIIMHLSSLCSEYNIKLTGGEISETPLINKADSIDIAGFIVGIRESQKNEPINDNDLIVGLPASGLHANGYTLIHNLIEKYKIQYSEKYKGNEISELLVKPTKIYLNDINEIEDVCIIKNIAHITGGGINNNLKRILNGYGADIYYNQFPTLTIYEFLEEILKLNKIEISEVFNFGIGMLLIMNEAELKKFPANIEHYVVGKVNISKEIKILWK